MLDVSGLFVPDFVMLRNVRPSAPVELLHEGQIEAQKVVAERAVKVDGGHSPRLADGLRAAGHRHVIEVRDAFGLDEIRDEELAAPQTPVRAKAEPVHRHADDLALDAVVGHAARDVRVVVLDADLLKFIVERERVLRREVFGVEVVRDHVGAAVERGA